MIDVTGIDFDSLAEGLNALRGSIQKIGGVALRCAMTGNVDVVSKIRGAFDGIVKSAEATGAILDGIIELEDQFRGFVRVPLKSDLR